MRSWSASAVLRCAGGASCTVAIVRFCWPFWAVGWWVAEGERARSMFLAGMADERRAAFAVGADSIVVVVDAVSNAEFACGFVA